MTSHTLRHYFISNCVMSNINMFTIAKWTGHASNQCCSGYWLAGLVNAFETNSSQLR